MAAVQAKLNGFFPPDFTADGRVMIDLAALPPASEPWPVEIGDARPLQAKAASEAEFFDHYGFVLLGHRTAVTDWTVDPAAPANESAVGRTYFPEIEALVRERLFPGRKLMVLQPSTPRRRGRDTPLQYGAGVHQDLGLTPDDFQESLNAFASEEIGRRWRGAFEQESVAGFMMLDFWRPTNMSGPLKHMPLALCDPNTVETADLVPSGLLNFAPSGRPTNQLSLRHNPGQAWWYYPDMRPDEVLVFKLFEYFKRDSKQGAFRTCFHAAFEDPTAPADAEHRQSCEHRVNVTFLKDDPS